MAGCKRPDATRLGYIIAHSNTAARHPGQRDEEFADFCDGGSGKMSKHDSEKIAVADHESQVRLVLSSSLFRVSTMQHDKP